MAVSSLIVLFVDQEILVFLKHGMTIPVLACVCATHLWSFVVCNMILFERSLCHFRMVKMWSHNISCHSSFPITGSTSLTFMLLLSTELRLLRAPQCLQSLWDLSADLHQTAPCHSWGYALIICKYSSLINIKFHTLWVILYHQRLCHLTVPSLSRPVGNDFTHVFMWETHWFLL